MFDDEVSGEEELAQPPGRRRVWQIGAGLAVLAVVAGIVVGLTRNDTDPPEARPSTRAASPVVQGPVIPTFAPRTGSAYNSTMTTTFLLGRPVTRVTLDGHVPLLFASCPRKASRCRGRFHVPDAVRQAMRTVVPGCAPVLDDLIHGHAGRTQVSDRQVLCRGHGLRVLVNIARVHSSAPSLVVHDRGMQLVVSLPHGPYTVQVIEQGDRLELPDLRKARALAADPRLLAGTS